LIAFIATYGALTTIVFFWGADPVEHYVNLWTAKTTAWALRLLGAEGRAHEVIVESSVSTIRIISECTALFPAVMFVSAVVAFPALWKQKLLAALGLPVLAIVNLVRIVSLCYIDHFFPQLMQTAHVVVWQSLMIFFTVLLWLLWAARSMSHHEHPPA
jgi:exosortase/archaeosortase family protein